MTIAYRPAEIEDATFVVPTWSRAYKESRSAGMIADEDWPIVMHPQIQKVLARPGVQTLIAYENTDPSFLYGYIVATPQTYPQVVFFTYVKEAYRRAGYARGLFAAIGIEPTSAFRYTCWTPVIPKLVDAGAIPRAKHVPGYARIVGYVESEARSPDRWKR